MFIPFFILLFLLALGLCHEIFKGKPLQLEVTSSDRIKYNFWIRTFRPLEPQPDTQCMATTRY